MVEKLDKTKPNLSLADQEGAAVMEEGANPSADFLNAVKAGRTAEAAQICKEEPTVRETADELSKFLQAQAEYEEEKRRQRPDSDSLDLAA
jgi:hypothetical protein